jgi:hypothetical protein
MRYIQILLHAEPFLRNQFKSGLCITLSCYIQLIRTKIKIASKVSLEIHITDFAENHTAIPQGQMGIIFV